MLFSRTLVHTHLYFILIAFVFHCVLETQPLMKVIDLLVSFLFFRYLNSAVVELNLEVEYLSFAVTLVSSVQIFSIFKYPYGQYVTSFTTSIVRIDLPE